MSNPTATNQAGEDELKTIIEWYINRTSVLAKQDGTSFNNKHLLELDMATAIEAIIRTEKLKLLAEVRERVIGEDKKPTGSMTGLITIDVARNKLRAEMRNELTKLEAEL